MDFDDASLIFSGRHCVSVWEMARSISLSANVGEAEKQMVYNKIISAGTIYERGKRYSQQHVVFIIVLVNNSRLKYWLYRNRSLMNMSCLQYSNNTSHSVHTVCRGWLHGNHHMFTSLLVFLWVTCIQMCLNITGRFPKKFKEWQNKT